MSTNELLDDPTILILPKRKTRSVQVDAEEVVASVLKRLSNDLSDRSEWMENQLRRYAKYKGWTETKAWQFEDASHAHIPIIMYTCQRIEDSLCNAVISQRPIMQAKALQRQNAPQEKRVDHLLDHEFFVQANAERLLGDLVHNFVVDGTVHVMIPWVRGQRTVRLFDRAPGPPPGTDLLAYLYGQFIALYGEATTIVSRKDHRFVLQSPEGKVEVEVYEGADGDLEIVEQRELRIDHLGLSVEDLEDIVVPSDCTNPQPPSESNPRGAHHVTRLCTASLDTIRARQKQEIYDLLTTDDLDTIATWTDQVGTDETSQPKEQKDEMEGVETQTPLATHGTVRILEVYDRWDVDGDGLEEDVVFHIVCNGGMSEGRLARARYLTEIIPPGPQGARRPIEKFNLFPDTNRYYCPSMPEQIEGMSDLINLFFNFGADSGVLSNMPFFFYRAASGLKADIMKLNPGEGYPLDDPRTDVYFPQLPNAQGAWVMNTIAMCNQFLEKLSMQSQLSFGGVPQGKSAALRTTDNMQAVLQQGDVRIERVLRRLFEGLSRVWDQGLALCQRYLPPSTEYRIMGVAKEEEAFDRIEDRKEIAGQFTFQWRATMTNTNPMMQQQTALSLVQILSSPFLLQMGIVGPEEVYRAVRRYVETLEEANSDQYLKRPAGVSSAMKLTAEQVVSMILSGRAPTEVNAAEPIEEHAKTLGTFMQSDQFGMLDTQQVTLFRDYLKLVGEAMARQQQQAQQMQLAQQFQQQLGGGDGQPGAPPSGPPSPAATSMSMASPAEAGQMPQGMM